MEATSSTYALQGYSPFFALPSELQNEIFSYTNIKDIPVIALTCSVFNKVISTKINAELYHVSKLTEFTVKLIETENLKTNIELRESIKSMLLNQDIFESPLADKKVAICEGIELLQEIFNWDEDTIDLVKKFIFKPDMKSESCVLEVDNWKICPIVLKSMLDIYSYNKSNEDIRAIRDRITREIKKLAENGKYSLAIREMKTENLLPFHQTEIAGFILGLLSKNGKNDIHFKIPKTMHKNLKIKSFIDFMKEFEPLGKMGTGGKYGAIWNLSFPLLFGIKHVTGRDDLTAVLASIITLIMLLYLITMIWECARYCRGHSRHFPCC